MSHLVCFLGRVGAKLVGAEPPSPISRLCRVTPSRGLAQPACLG